MKLCCSIQARLAIVGAVALVTLIAACIFFRISRPRDLSSYYGMARECHPVWRHCAFRRSGAGDSAADFLRRFPPSSREEFGRYGIYTYYPGSADDGIWFTGLAVITRDGRLIRSEAWSCTWQFTFFDSPDPSFATQYAAFTQERTERLRQQREELNFLRASGVASQLSTIEFPVRPIPVGENQVRGFPPLISSIYNYIF